MISTTQNIYEYKISKLTKNIFEHLYFTFFDAITVKSKDLKKYLNL